MRRWETFASLTAVILASLSAVTFGGRQHPQLALAAIALLLFVVFARLRAKIIARNRDVLPGAYERALRIQEQRERKYGR